MRYFHRTSAWPAIQAEGWRDSTGYYLTLNEYSGVWISNVPLDCNEGAQGEWLLTIELPDHLSEVLDREYEWVEEDEEIREWKRYREWLVPASLLNEHGTVVHVEHDPG